MKKDQKQRIAIVGLATLMILLIAVQVLGAGSNVAKPKTPQAATTIVAQTTPHHKALEAPVIARDVFWHPRLAEEEAGKHPSLSSPPPKPIANPLPNPMPDSERWVPPLNPGKIEILPDATGAKSAKPEKTAQDPPKKEEIPKKRLRVCGFLSNSQTPTLILTLDDDLKTCTKGQQPWPEVTILEIGFDQATLKLQNRTIKVTMGQEVEM